MSRQPTETVQPLVTPLLPPTGLLPVRRERRPDPPEAIRVWLAGAHAGAARVRQEWRRQRVALLTLGPGIGAVRIPGAIVHEAVGSDDHQAVATAARTELRGPLIRDVLATGPTYWALTEYHTGVTWVDVARTPLLGWGTYLGVPDITVTEPPGPYWVEPPRWRGDLCYRPTLFDFIMRGAGLVPGPASSAGTEQV